MSPGRCLLIAVSVAMVNIGSGEQHRRILMNDASYVHSLEQKVQELTNQFSNFQLNNSNLNQKLLNLQTVNADLTQRLTALEQYRNSRRSCETGSKYLRSQYPATLNLPQTEHIGFAEHFQKIPIVTVGIAELDVGSSHNLRILVQATSVTSTGFSITFSDWNDSDTYSVTATWIACPNE